MSDKEQRLKIASRLRQARTLAGLSQGQVALRMKMHRPSITEIEGGNRRVSVDELKSFAGLYDVSVAYLSGDVPDTVSLDDPSIQLAARELQKLPPESLDKLLSALAALKTSNKNDK